MTLSFRNSLQEFFSLDIPRIRGPRRIRTLEFRTSPIAGWASPIIWADDIVKVERHRCEHSGTKLLHARMILTNFASTATICTTETNSVSQSWFAGELMNGISLRVCICCCMVVVLIGCGQHESGDVSTETATATNSPVESELPEILLTALRVEKDAKVTFQHSEFGKTADDKSIEQYTLKNSNKVTVKLINYGATVVSVETPDRDGKLSNIVLGHSSVEHWLSNPCYFGSTVGRYANRIGGAVFGLNGNIYNLAANDGDNHLHGGKQGFHKALWNAEATNDESSASVQFTRVSPDGEDGYPGNLETSVTYTLTNDDELRIEYEAKTDKPTVVNLTNHCYWNLTGNAAEDNVLGHRLTLTCNLYLPVDGKLIPTGDMTAVAESPLIFYEPHTIGERIEKVEGGYDHCFVINREVDGLAPAARVVDPKSGRVMEISTTEPGIQFYSGNFLSGKEDNGGFAKHHGFCLETQHYPDSPNQPHFPTTTLKPGDTYKSATIHKFSVEK